MKINCNYKKKIKKNQIKINLLKFQLNHQLHMKSINHKYLAILNYKNYLIDLLQFHSKVIDKVLNNLITINKNNQKMKEMDHF